MLNVIERLTSNIERRTLNAQHSTSKAHRPSPVDHLFRRCRIDNSKPVGTNADLMLELALTRLRDQGCRNIGMISAVRIPPNVAHPYFRMFEKFIHLVSDLGLKTRDNWIVIPDGGLPSHERFGYTAFQRLWSQPEQSEGVFVYPDTSARGVMTALLELGVSVPDQLKVVFHRNSGVDWHCPLAVDQVESDTARWAAEMITQVRRQMEGQAIATVKLPFRMG